jgi:preprotein translocase subunit Sec61beta
MAHGSSDRRRQRRDAPSGSGMASYFDKAAW